MVHPENGNDVLAKGSEMMNILNGEKGDIQQEEDDHHKLLGWQDDEGSDSSVIVLSESDIGLFPMESDFGQVEVNALQTKKPRYQKKS